MDSNDQPQSKQPKEEVNQEDSEPQNVPQGQSSTDNFYGNEASPFMRASPRLKQFLLKYKQNQKLAIDKINMDDLGYEIKQTKNNICSRFFEIGEKYFLCKECALIEEAGVNMCLCLRCFDPSKHLGHTTIQQVSKCEDSFCDCGRVNSVKKQCFCETHSTYYQQLQCQINEEQKQQFVKTFTVLLDCAMFLGKDKKFYQKICNYLCKLNERSIYYNRLTYQVMIINSQNLFPADQADLNIISSYYVMFSCYCLTNKLIIHMTGDIKTRKLFIKFVCKILWNLGQMGVNLVEKFLPERYFAELFDITAVLQLIQEGYTNPTFEIALGKKGHSQQSHKALRLYMDKKIGAIKGMKQIFSIKTELIKGQIALKLLTKLIELYPTDQAIVKQSNQQYGQYQNKNQILLPQDIKTANILILKFALMVSVNSSLQLVEIRKNLKAFVSAVQLDRILLWILPTVKSILTSEVSLGQYICISVFLLLVKGSLFQKQIISKLWNMILHSTQLQKQKQLNQAKGVLPYTQIHLFSDIFMKFVTVLINTQIYRILQKKKSFISQRKQKMSEGEEQIMSDWLKGFLYARKILKKQIIIQMKLGGIFDFKDASKILNEVCTYDSRQDLFYYTSAQKYENILYKFPFVISKQNYNVIYSIRIHFGMEQDLPENSLPKMLLQQAFNYQNIIPQIDAEWQRYLKSAQKNDGKYMYGYLYLFVLVAYNIFTHGRNKELRERLEILRSDESYLENYSNKKEQIKLIKRLLNMQNKQQTPKKQKQIIEDQFFEVQNQQQQEVQQQGSQQNSENIMVDNRSQNKSKKIISPVKSPNKQKVEQKQGNEPKQPLNWDQICVVCKQKQKLNNQLAFTALINKNSTGCSAVYGKNSLTNTTLMTCFHKIHVNCYATINKTQIFVYECTVCQTVRNCILPVKYMKQNERLNKLSSNSIILAVLAIYGVYDVQDQFMLIFKHLVQQGGLKAILMFDRSQQSKQQWDTINMYLRVLIVDMYRHASQKIRRVHARHIQEFIQQIKKCEKIQCREIQFLIADLYKSILIDRSPKFNIQLVQNIRSSLPQHQFNAVKSELQKITATHPLQLNPLTEQQQAKQKKPIGFYLLNLPKTAQEMAEKYLSRKCENGDNQQAACICLICLKILCSKCKPNHFKEHHSDITVCFSLQALRIELMRMNCPTSYQIYYNEYKMSLEEGIKHKMSDTQYILDEPKYEKIVRTYLYI